MLPRDASVGLAQQHHTLSGDKVALDLQQPAEVSHDAERVQMPITEGLALPLQRLAQQRLRGSEVALVLQ